MPELDFLDDPEFPKRLRHIINDELRRERIASPDPEALARFLEDQIKVYLPTLRRQEAALSGKDQHTGKDVVTSVRTLLMDAVRINRVHGTTTKDFRLFVPQVTLADLKQAHKDKFCRIFPFCASASPEEGAR